MLEQWLRARAFVKFVGDNVDKQVNVRDVRKNHHGKLMHMFSIFAVKARVSPPALVSDFIQPILSTDNSTCFLPSQEDMSIIIGDLEVLISRILCDYIKAFEGMKRLITKHIPHACSEQMAAKSEVVVLDVLHYNEIESSDMVKIMQTILFYLKSHCKHTVLSGGDHMTCEREQGAKRQVQCSNKSEGRLEQMEPCVEEWHCVMNFMIVSYM